ncbi:F0F1 ATP synthase subunit B [Patescibacteria group bacterium]|nr:F0F1 ATP synthase subunit B [Patescibacteria group bacterium]MBU1895999.1 F0F1 ATP synthase subunit B [Patescibacteria group bacterium]
MIENTHEEVGVEAQNDSVVASLGLNVNLFIFQLANFAIVSAIIWFMILKPLVNKMEERKKLVDESVDNAKRIESNIQISEQKFQEKIDEAKVEANQVIARAQIEADSLAGRMRGKAEADVEELIKQAKAKIGEEKDKMTQELRTETGALVVATLEKVLSKSIDSETDKKLIEDALKKL